MRIHNRNTLTWGLAVCAMAMQCGLAHVRADTPSDEDRLELAGSSEERQEVIYAGETRTLSAVLHNRGTRCIKIAKLMLTNCGCDGGTATPNVLEPGQSAQLRFKPATAGSKGGMASTKFTVRTEDDRIIPVAGEITYVIRRDVAITPSALDLGVLRPRELVERTIQMVIASTLQPKIVLGTSSDVERVAVEVLPDAQAANVESGVSRGPKTYLLKLTATAPQDPGAFTVPVDIVLESFDGTDRHFKISVSGRVPPEVESSPRQLFLGYLHSGIAVTRDLTLTSRSQGALSVESVKGPSWASVEFQCNSPVVGKGNVRITLKVTGVAPASGADLLEATLKAEGKSKIIKIPIVFVAAGQD